MLKKPSLDEIEKLVIPLRKDSYSGKSDYQRLELEANNYRTIAALGASTLSFKASENLSVLCGEK